MKYIFDKRIIILDKHNSGYRDSMNKAIDVAFGEYNWIKWFKKITFKILYNFHKNWSIDLKLSNFDLYWDENNKYIFKFRKNIKSIIK